jgi:hypothetical protein
VCREGAGRSLHDVEEDLRRPPVAGRRAGLACESRPRRSASDPSCRNRRGRHSDRRPRSRASNCAATSWPRPPRRRRPARHDRR